MPDVSKSGAAIELALDHEEVHVLSGLLDEMESLLRADIPKSDAVVARLFPQAYQDPDEQESYEELTSATLVAAKIEAVRDLRERLNGTKDGGASLIVDDENSGPLLALLTDLRLAIGTRLDVDAEMMSIELDPDDPDAPALAVLHWLGWVQGAILDEMGY
jgi:hypothetical protein